MNSQKNQFIPPSFPFHWFFGESIIELHWDRKQMTTEIAGKKKHIIYRFSFSSFAFHFSEGKSKLTFPRSKSCDLWHLIAGNWTCVVKFAGNSLYCSSRKVNILMWSPHLFSIYIFKSNIRPEGPWRIFHLGNYSSES